MAVIQSHTNPYKSLARHVKEVLEAGLKIINLHSPGTRKLLWPALKFAILFHDLGKAIQAFQEYIKAPDQYPTTQKFLKSHTPTSLAWWIIHAQKNKIPRDTVLVVAAVVWRHHGDFPTLEELIYESRYDYEEDFPIADYPVDTVNQELGMELSAVCRAVKFKKLVPLSHLKNKSLDQAAAIKLKAQILLSILMQADRSHLALTEKYMTPQPRVEIPPGRVDEFIHQKNKGAPSPSPINQARTHVREKIIANSRPGPGIEMVTLPTGLGKTLVAAQWSLTHRTLHKNKQKVILVLPFLSIIDQTAREYKALLEKIKTPNLFLESHSIALREYKEKDETDRVNDHNNAIDFFAETWQYDFIVTTFDQFLYALFSAGKSHIIRSHNLADALIIIDEIQALPPQLWAPLNLAVQTLTREFNSKLLIMSATQPGFIQGRELVPAPPSIFARQKRYQLLLNHKTPQSLDEFIDACIQRTETENWHDQRVLIVLNTRKSARKVIDALELQVHCPSYFLSADVTPGERLDAIAKIGKGKPCLVVATQCIEAGVDIDMDMGIRDFAPLDAIVQFAGRCNRNGKKPQAKIKIVSLEDSNGKPFSGYVYDSILLEKTKTILDLPHTALPEEKIFPLVSRYFQDLKQSKDTGINHAENWARWIKDIKIKKLLRGDNERINLIVASQDKPPKGGLPLKQAVQQALEIQDRWERARELRSLKSRISQVSVSIWASPRVQTEEISDKIGCYHFLHDNLYKPGRGLELPDPETSCIF